MKFFVKLLNRCTECNRIFAMKEFEKRLLEKQDIKILETLSQPHLKGEIQRAVERFVPGERTIYEVTYQCRFCKAKQTKLVYKDIKKYDG